MRVMLFGADGFGRDQFSRFLHGGRLSLFAGLLATALAIVLGAAVGLVAGAAGGLADRVAMFAADVVTTLPWVYPVDRRAVGPAACAAPGGRVDCHHRPGWGRRLGPTGEGRARRRFEGS